MCLCLRSNCCCAGCVHMCRDLTVCVLQEDNGMPVHLKGGSADALLYRMTMVLTVIGENDADAANSHSITLFVLSQPLPPAHFGVELSCPELFHIWSDLPFSGFMRAFHRLEY